MEQTYSQKTDKVVQPKGNEYGSVTDLSGQSEDLQNKNKLTSTTAQCKNHFTRDCSGQAASLQSKSNMMNDVMQQKPVTPPSLNNTGLPDDLKNGIESLSGYSLDDVRVHYNSSKPATVQALAYTQGTEIHVAPGQEHTLPHEAWHVTQQMAGRVSPTTTVSDMPINDNDSLEHEADIMGEKAAQRKEIRSEAVTQQKTSESINQNVAQRYIQSVKYAEKEDEKDEIKTIDYFEQILAADNGTCFKSRKHGSNKNDSDITGKINETKARYSDIINNITNDETLGQLTNSPSIKKIITDNKNNEQGDIIKTIKQTCILNCSTAEEIDNELKTTIPAAIPEEHGTVPGKNYFYRSKGDHLYNYIGKTLDELGIKDDCGFSEAREKYVARSIRHAQNESDGNRLNYGLAINAFKQTYKFYRDYIDTYPYKKGPKFTQTEQNIANKLNELLDTLFTAAIDSDVKKFYEGTQLPKYKKGDTFYDPQDKTEAGLDNPNTPFSAIQAEFNKIKGDIAKKYFPLKTNTQTTA